MSGNNGLLYNTAGCLFRFVLSWLFLFKKLSVLGIVLFVMSGSAVSADSGKLDFHIKNITSIESMPYNSYGENSIFRVNFDVARNGSASKINIYKKIYGTKKKLLVRIDNEDTWFFNNEDISVDIGKEGMVVTIRRMSGEKEGEYRVLIKNGEESIMREVFIGMVCPDGIKDVRLDFNHPFKETVHDEYKYPVRSGAFYSIQDIDYTLCLNESQVATLGIYLQFDVNKNTTFGRVYMQDIYKRSSLMSSFKKHPRFGGICEYNDISSDNNFAGDFNFKVGSNGMNYSVAVRDLNDKNKFFYDISINSGHRNVRVEIDKDHNNNNCKPSEIKVVAPTSEASRLGTLNFKVLGAIIATIFGGYQYSL